MNSGMEKSREEIRTNFKKHVGAVIKHERKKAGIKQSSLSKWLDVDQATVSKYESGRIDMPVSNMPLISNYCDFNIRDFLSEYRDEAPHRKYRKLRHYAEYSNRLVDGKEIEQYNAKDEEFDLVIKSDRVMTALLYVGVEFAEIMLDVDAEIYALRTLKRMIEEAIAARVDIQFKARIMAYFNALQVEVEDG